MIAARCILPFMCHIPPTDLTFPALDNSVRMDAAMTGIAVYTCSMIMLSGWDYYSSPNRLTKDEIQQKWIEPWESDRSVPPPSIEALRKEDYGIGFRKSRKSTIWQFITVRDDPTKIKKGEREMSEAWTEHYDTPVTIYKKK